MAKYPAFLDHGWYCVNDFTHVVPRKAGNYAIFLYDPKTKKLRLMYVGTAENLYRRVNQRHEVFRTLFALSDIHGCCVVAYVVEVDDDMERSKMEKEIIQEYKPEIC